MSVLEAASRASGSPFSAAPFTPLTLTHASCRHCGEFRGCMALQSVHGTHRNTGELRGGGRRADALRGAQLDHLPHRHRSLGLWTSSAPTVRAFYPCSRLEPSVTHFFSDRLARVGRGSPLHGTSRSARVRRAAARHACRPTTRALPHACSHPPHPCFLGDTGHSL